MTTDVCQEKIRLNTQLSSCPDGNSLNQDCDSRPHHTRPVLSGLHLLTIWNFTHFRNSTPRLHQISMRRKYMAV